MMNKTGRIELRKETAGARVLRKLRWSVCVLGLAGCGRCSDPPDTACDDGNPCTIHAFMDDRCQFTPVAFGTTCSDRKSECDDALACDGAGHCSLTIPASSSACLPKDRLIEASDPRIAGASLQVPAGAAPPEQSFTIAVDEALAPSTTQLGYTTLGYAITAVADGKDNFFFSKANSGECAKLTIPFDLGQFARSSAAVRTSARIYQVIGGQLFPVGGTLDLSAGLARTCVAHLSTYVVAEASTCHPLAFAVHYDDNSYLTADSITNIILQTPVTIAIPSYLDASGIGYIDLNYGDSGFTDVKVCHYSGSGAFIACSDGSLPGDAITATRFEIGSEGNPGGTIFFDPELTAATCPASCAPIADNCGGTLDCADDGNACTVDTCDLVSGNATHSPRPAGSPCPDADPCDGEEVCGAMGDCLESSPPALDDGDPCTADICEPSTGVQHLEAFGNCEQRVSDFVQSWCPSGAVSTFNEATYDYCIRGVINSGASVVTQQDEAAWLESALWCVKAYVTCADGAGASGGQSAPFVIPSPFQRRYCSDENYVKAENCRQDALTGALIAVSACSAGLKAGGRGPAFAICVIAALAKTDYDLYRCLRDFTIPADSCCPQEIECDGTCYYASKCP